MKGLHIKQLNYLLLGVAAVLRIRPYLFNRSLWHDEASLAYNLILKDFNGLLDTSTYYSGQIAPLGFMYFAKASSLIFGMNEMALRLLPLIAGLGSIYLLYIIAMKIGGNMLAFITLCLATFADPLIYYSSEFKQYHLDAFTALIMFSMAFKIQNIGRIKNIVMLSLVGAFLIWFSQPLVFSLVPIGMYWLWKTYLSKEETKWSFAPAFIIGGIWIVSFLVNYFLLLAPHKHNPDAIADLMKFHADAFAPFPPLSKDQLLWWWYSFINMFESPLGFTLTGLAAALYSIGIFAAFKRSKTSILWMQLPILFALFASALHLYPFHGRLLLFGLGGLLIALAYGLKWIAEQTEYPKAILLIFIIFLLQKPAFSSLHKLVNPFSGEDIKGSLSFMSDKLKDGDIIFVYNGADHAFRFYKDQYIHTDVEVIYGTASRQNYGVYEEELTKLDGKGRTWIVFSHVYPWDDTRGEEMFHLKVLDNIGKKITEHNPNYWRGNSCYLYEL